jgi:hypothetical protein
VKSRLAALPDLVCMVRQMNRELGQRFP